MIALVVIRYISISFIKVTGGKTG